MEEKGGGEGGVEYGGDGGGREVGRVESSSFL